MFFTPFLRRMAIACFTSLELCLLFIQRSILSSNDCTPILIRVTPMESRDFTYSSPFSTISSGFTSTVNSWYSCNSIPKTFVLRCLTILSSTIKGSTDGVPPPMYSVSTFSPISVEGRVARISFTRASVSEHTASAYLANLSKLLS